jgi:penicillin-binding protein 1A
MTAAYSGIANMGIKVDPVVVTKVVDRDGDVIFEATPKKTQVLKPSTAYLMIDMMKDVIRRGTAYGFTGGFKGWPAAGKTGTTEYNRDGWFIGFTPDLVTTVWNGYDDSAGNKGLPYTGAFVPVKIWNQFMTRAVTQRPADWTKPTDVVPVQICRLTGALPSDTCPKDQVVTDLFVKGTEPKDAGTILVKAKAIQVTTVSADKKTTSTEWQLWQAGCLAIPQEKVFIRRPTARVQHPTDPWNPKFVPADAKDELPTKTCTPGPGGWLDRLIPNLPGLPWGPGSGDQQQPGAGGANQKPGKGH